jgi:hypothetical protein
VAVKRLFYSRPGINGVLRDQIDRVFVGSRQFISGSGHSPSATEAKLHARLFQSFGSVIAQIADEANAMSPRRIDDLLDPTAGQFRDFAGPTSAERFRSRRFAQDAITILLRFFEAAHGIS